MPTILWTDLNADGVPFHFRKNLYKAGESFLRHDHDFGELMLTESGSGEHRINGTVLELLPGSLTFIRPSDRHSITAGAAGLVLLNCAVPGFRIDEIEAKYFGPDNGFFACGDSLPKTFRLRGDQFSGALGFFSRLGEQRPTVFGLDFFLLNIYGLVREHHPDLLPGNAPEWLRRACREIRTEENLKAGISRFFDLAGKSKEHTSREMKKFTRMTPVEYLTEIRLEKARTLLCTCDLPVLEISGLCGFENLSWFHRSFRKRYQTTPLGYRKRFQF